MLNDKKKINGIDGIDHSKAFHSKNSQSSCSLRHLDLHMRLGEDTLVTNQSRDPPHLLKQETRLKRKS